MRAAEKIAGRIRHTEIISMRNNPKDVPATDADVIGFIYPVYHWTIQYAIHRISMQARLPSIQRMIEKASEEGIARNVLNVDIITLASIILNGVEGILHAKPIEKLDPNEIKKIRNDTIDCVEYMLNMELQN